MVTLFGFFCCVLIFYLLTMIAALALSDDTYLPKRYLEGPYPSRMDAEALERYGFLVEELREQYLERRRLLKTHPRRGYVVVNSATRLRARPRRQEIRQLCKLSELRLREVHAACDPGKAETN